MYKIIYYVLPRTIHGINTMTTQIGYSITRYIVERIVVMGDYWWYVMHTIFFPASVRFRYFEIVEKRLTMVFMPVHCLPVQILLLNEVRLKKYSFKLKFSRKQVNVAI